MKIALLLLGWLFAILFGLVALSMVLTRNYLQLIPLVLLVLVVWPPAAPLIENLVGLSLPWWGRAISIAVLLAAFVMMFSLNQPESIYASPTAEARFMEVYDAKLADWPVPCETRYLDTEYGRVHVIVSGPENGPPALLLHAAGVSSWSWRYNVAALNERYRTYAIDTLGEVGKSRLDNLSNIPADGKAWADLHAAMADMLGIQGAYVVGASYGGFIATNYALYYPERVEKLALLGPMGMTPATGSTVMRIMLVALFPVDPLKVSTTHWALGEDAFVQREYGEWFGLMMSSVAPKEAAPVAFTPEQLQGVQVPVLLVLGQRDALTGDPQAVKDLAGHVPGIQIEVLDTGHLMGVEQSRTVNQLVTTFFAAP